MPELQNSAFLPSCDSHAQNACCKTRHPILVWEGGVEGLKECGAGLETTAWEQWVKPLLSHALSVAPQDYAETWACGLRYTVFSLASVSPEGLQHILDLLTSQSITSGLSSTAVGCNPPCLNLLPWGVCIVYLMSKHTSLPALRQLVCVRCIPTRLSLRLAPPLSLRLLWNSNHGCIIFVTRQADMHRTFLYMICCVLHSALV